MCQARVGLLSDTLPEFPNSIPQVKRAGGCVVLRMEPCTQPVSVRDFRLFSMFLYFGLLRFLLHELQLFI